MERKINVQSGAFRPGQRIPERYTGDGDNVSPSLKWTGVPQGTAELVVVVEDPDAPKPEPFAHWVVYHIPPGLEGLPEGAGDGKGLPKGAVPGKNSFRTTEYKGPDPPPGPAHHYHFTVYALNKRLDLPKGADRGALAKAMEGHILAKGDLVGVYGR